MGTTTQLNGLTVVKSNPNSYTILDSNGYTYLLTDIFNNAVHTPGRMQLREVRNANGDIIIGYGTADYQLQVSTSMDLSATPREWYDYQGPGKSDLRLSQYEHYGNDYFELGYTVMYYDSFNEEDVIAVVEHKHRFFPTAYEHAVRRVATKHICVWLEYAAMVPTRGVTHTAEYIDEIELIRPDGGIVTGIVSADVNGNPGYFDLEGVGLLGPSDTSDYANVGTVERFKMHMAHETIDVTLSRPMELQVGDHGGPYTYGRVIPYAVDHFGVQGVDAGDIFEAAWYVEITPQ